MHLLVNWRRGWRIEALDDDEAAFGGGSTLGTCKGREEEGKFLWVRCFIRLAGGADILEEISTKGK